MSGLQSELPGQQSEIPGLQSEIPGQQSELPGLQSEKPGFKSGNTWIKIRKCLEVNPEIPGLKSGNVETGELIDGTEELEDGNLRGFLNPEKGFCPPQS